MIGAIPILDKKELVTQGEKTMEILPGRKFAAKLAFVNYAIPLYYKPKSRNREYLGDAVIKRVSVIRFIRQDYRFATSKHYEKGFYWHMEILDKGEWRKITQEELNYIAKKSGFSDGGELIAYMFDMYGDDLFSVEFTVVEWEVAK